jgi:hypothetical protein
MDDIAEMELEDSMFEELEKRGKKPGEGRFDEIAVDVLAPIMRKIDEVAFSTIGQTPLSIKDGVIEKLEEAIEYLDEQASFSDSASIIGFALGKDGLRPGQKLRHMIAIVTAMRDLIKARNDQVKDELSYECEHKMSEYLASMLGF